MRKLYLGLLAALLAAPAAVTAQSFAPTSGQPMTYTVEPEQGKVSACPDVIKMTWKWDSPADALFGESNVVYQNNGPEKKAIVTRNGEQIGLGLVTSRRSTLAEILIEKSEMDLSADGVYMIEVTTASKALLDYNYDTPVSFTLTYTVGDASGIEGIEAEGQATYYNLQGQPVANPQSGVFVRMAGGKATKVRL